MTDVQLVTDGLAGIPARWRELGRIRLGKKSGDGKPQRLEHWRLTSKSRDLIDEAAGVYGGAVTPWTRDGASEWQVTTEVESLPVLIPPAPAAFRQSWELWTADGCQRDCDGLTDRINNRACTCPANIDDRADAAAKGKACKPITRLSVILLDLTGMGIWQLSTTGRNAAAEFAAIAPLLRRAMAASLMFRCNLRIEARSSKQPGKPRHDFVVPVPDVPVKLGLMLDSMGIDDQLALASEPRVSLPTSSAPALPAPGASQPVLRSVANREPAFPPDGEEAPPRPGPAGVRNALDAAKRITR